MGAFIGPVVGETKIIGIALGEMLGALVCFLVGVSDGAKLGSFDGESVLGATTGDDVGIADGTKVDISDGKEVAGVFTGEVVGDTLVNFETVAEEDGSKVDCGQKRVS